jgi:HEPN domain-containing protein
MAAKSRVSDWLFLIKEDLKTAEVSLRENIVSSSCFHSQQVAEKSLKVLMAYRGKEIPKSHDLLFLLERTIKFYPKLAKFKKDLQFLNQFYVPTRYPEALPGSLPRGVAEKRRRYQGFKDC